MLIAQLSDTHVVVDAPHPDGRPTRADQMRLAVEHVLALRRRPDLVFVTGDCTEHGTEEETDLFRSLLAPLPMPVHVIPGNHDRREVLLSRFGDQGSHALEGFMQYVVDGHAVRLVALDTHDPGKDTGLLCEARLDWLEYRLAEAPGRPTMILMHHPPFETGMRVLDSLGLAGREAFGEVIARHPQVERIVAGHIHCAMQRRVHGTLAMTCPSTGLQIAIEPGDPGRLWISEEPPAVLLHSWSAAGGLVSYASQVPVPPPARLLHDGSSWVG